MFGLWKKKPDADDAMRAARQGDAELMREIAALKRHVDELRRQINEVGARVIPDYKSK